MFGLNQWQQLSNQEFKHKKAGLFRKKNLNVKILFGSGKLGRSLIFTATKCTVARFQSRWLIICHRVHCVGEKQSLTEQFCCTCWKSDCKNLMVPLVTNYSFIACKKTVVWGDGGGIPACFHNSAWRHITLPYEMKHNWNAFRIFDQFDKHAMRQHKN